MNEFFNPLMGVIHFVGINGIGMSGIAKILHDKGYKVQGSDKGLGYSYQDLVDRGIKVHIGHSAENVENANWVVISSAIREDNVELMRARELKIPIIKRAEILGEIMSIYNSISVAGTHGKTTTTSLVGALLEEAGFDPTIVNGGIINSYKSNAKLGKGKWIVVEADESDGSFIHLRAQIAIVTNIDAEHMQHYGSFDNLKGSFRQFIENLPFYGMGILCYDHMVVRDLAQSIKSRKIVTYGFKDGADIQGVDVRSDKTGCNFRVKIRKEVVQAGWVNENIAHIEDGDEDIFLESCKLNLVGIHNVENALSLVPIMLSLNISWTSFCKALENFSGVKRRFTTVGYYKEAQIIDDYAHHPVEIKAVLGAARSLHGSKLIAVWQPHRYSRFMDLEQDFYNVLKDFDEVIVMPVYLAGEVCNEMSYIEPSAIAKRLSENFGKKQVRGINSQEELELFIAKTAKPKDKFIFMGAGSISQMAYDIVNTKSHF